MELEILSDLVTIYKDGVKRTVGKLQWEKLTEKGKLSSYDGWMRVDNSEKQSLKTFSPEIHLKGKDAVNDVSSKEKEVRDAMQQISAELKTSVPEIDLSKSLKPKDNGNKNLQDKK